MNLVSIYLEADISNVRQEFMKYRLWNVPKSIIVNKKVILNKIKDDDLKYLSSKTSRLGKIFILNLLYFNKRILTAFNMKVSSIGIYECTISDGEYEIFSFFERNCKYLKNIVISTWFDIPLQKSIKKLFFTNQTNITLHLTLLKKIPKLN